VTLVAGVTICRALSGLGPGNSTVQEIQVAENHRAIAATRAYPCERYV
jgi:hypothetical protein